MAMGLAGSSGGVFLDKGLLAAFFRVGRKHLHIRLVEVGSRSRAELTV